MSELPKGWCWVNIEDISERIHYGYTASSKNIPTDTKLLRITDIQDNSVNWEAVPFCEISEVERQKYLLTKGDLVFARTGATVGKSFLIEGDIPETVFASYLIRIILFKSIFEKFVYNFFRSESYWEQIHEKQVGTGQPNINSTVLSQIKIPLPPLNEQRRIVAKLDSLLGRTRKAREELEKIGKLCDRYKQAVLSAACSGKLTADWREQNTDIENTSELMERISISRRKQWEEIQIQNSKVLGKTLQGESWKTKYKPSEVINTHELITLPHNWSWASVDSISTKVVDGVHKKPNYVETGIPFVTVKNLSRGDGISFDDIKYISVEDHEDFVKRANPERGDILITKDGTLGITKVIRTSQVFSIFVSVALVKPVCYEMSDYLELAFSSPLLQKQMVGTGSGLMHIHLIDLRRYSLPIPPLTEQKEIVRRVEKLFKAIDTIQQETQKAFKLCDRLEQSTLAKAFRGELVPQDPDDEPASVLLERIAAEKQQAAASSPKSRTKTPKTKQLTLDDI
ncbi:restriction endonuclease subunit S [Merismopedia glauca]|uniref:restriction endonuclease subunit S n=1 Tax=Merismopedia glauca TaxID=292586 RepID=UPI0015E74811|nr:restriction endonuclease subunit S [Merismopedia glauca]